MRNKLTLTSIYTFLLFAAGFLLFWEWLRPLEQITDTGNLYLFVIYTAICFTASFFISNKLAVFLVKAFALLFIMDFLFIEPFFFSIEWFQIVLMEINYNIGAILDNNWLAITAFFRSFLFLLLLWLMSYLLHFWFIVANKFFLFVLLTVVYLAVLDTFTIYDAQMPIVRTFIISFLMLGISRYIKITQQTDGTDKKSGFYWITAVVVFVGAVTAIGWSSPKFSPQWPDPIPFIQSTANQAGFGEKTVQKVGYGEDDSQLGGSFVQDDSIVFEAAVPEIGYWRIESKDIYTGKGWERSTDLNYQPLEEGIIDWDRLMESTTDNTSHEAVIYPQARNQLEKAVYPYGAQSISSSRDIAFFMDENAGMIEFEGSEQSQSATYTVSYQPLSFSINQLQNSSEQDPDYISNKYLQLPGDLPDRVHELSAEIVGGLNTRYDKAKAIENYFSTNGYTYQIEDVSIPEAGEDYVDQFLFETRAGYCDNFSTSMVVMLRSLDIPARWVKGFTAGDYAASQPELLPEDYVLYEISNNNAHSWVEVYFPGSGWVPFEPTSGFSNPTDFYQETTSDYDYGETETEETESERAEEAEVDEEPIEQEDSAVPALDEQDDQPNYEMYIILVILLVFIGVMMLLFDRRKTIRDWYVRRKWKSLSNNLELESAYLYITKLLEKRGIIREKNQTLRQYAEEVDKELGTSEMYDITTYYEQLLYNQTIKKGDTKKLRSLFQRLIDQILA